MKKRYWILITLLVLGIVFFLSQLPRKPKGGMTRLIAEAKARQYPIREDGMVDYLAVANRNFSEVSPETNMLVDFVQCLGTEGYLEPDSQFEFEFLEKLGNPEIPDHDFYVAPETYVRENSDDPDEAVAQVENCYSTPWSKEEFPLLGEWIVKQTPHLDQFVVASEKPYYYHPLCQEDGVVIAALLPYAQTVREVARALSIRASYELNEGNIENCARDLIAIRKIGKALTNSGTLIESLIGCACIYHAFDIEDALVDELAKGASWPDEAIDQFRKAVRESTDLPSLNGPVDRGEGLFIRDVMQRMEKGDLDSAQLAFGGQEGVPSNLLKLAGRLVDWEAATDLVLKRHEQIIEALKIEDHVQRAAAVDKIEMELKKIERETNENVVQTAMSAFFSPQKRGEMIGQIMSSQLSPAMKAINSARTRTLMLDLTDTALALERYRRKEGRFPDSLDDLVPDFLPEVPDDRFRGQPVSYVVTDSGYRLWSWGINQRDEQSEPDGKLIPRPRPEGTNIDDVVIGVGD